MATRLKNLRIDEVSTVDRGAGRGVNVVLMKRADDSEVDKAVDLTIDSILRSESDDKAGLLARAFKSFRDYQQEGAMPLSKEDLAAIGDMVNDRIGKALEKAGIGFEKMTAEHSAYHGNLDGDEAKKFSSMAHDERTKYMKDHPITGGKDPDPNDNDEAEKALAKHIGPELASLIVKANKSKGPKVKPDEQDGDKDEEAEKMHKVELAKRDTQISDLQKQLGALVEKDQRAEFAKRAESIGLSEKDGETLLKAHRGDPEALKSLEDTISKLTTQVSKGDLFKEFGAGGGAPASAHDELVVKATELRKSDTKLTTEQAYAKVLKDPANAELAKRERVERSNRINGRAA